MAINHKRSFEVSENGITIDSGNEIWIGGGDAVPTHNAPEGSQYYRTSPAETYVQEGPGETNNWVVFSDLDEKVGVSSNDSAAGYLEDKIAATEGIQQATLNDGADEDLQLKLDINGLTADATPDVDNDYLATYDVSAGVHKKTLITDVLDEATSPAAYGNLFQENGAGYQIPVAAQDVWYKWDNASLGPVSGPITLSAANDNITLGTDALGTYEIEYSVTITSETNNHLVEGAFFLNDVVIGKTRASIQTESGDEQTLSFSCLMSLNDGDVLDFRVRNRTSGNQADIYIYNACINVSRMSGGSRGPKGDPGSGSTVVIKDEGTLVPNGPHDTFNFVGPNFNISDAGGGEATITHSSTTHTGEVTGTNSLTVNKTAITNKPTISAESGDFVLVSDTSDTGNLKKVDINDLLDNVDTGEDNTASNVGTAGVGVFKQKTGVDLEFKKINAGSTKVSITDDVANNEIDIDVNEANLNITASQVTDFDTEVSNNSSVTANTAKVTNATHTGEMTGATSLSADKTIISNKTSVTVASTDEILISDASDTGNLKKVTAQSIADLGGGGGHTIQEEGTPLTQRSNLNFIGANVTATDNAGTDSTDITIIGGAASDMPVLSLSRSTTFSVPATPANLAFDIEDIENLPLELEHDDTNTARVYLRSTGYYLGIVSMILENTGTQTRTFTIEAWKNDTTLLSTTAFDLAKNAPEHITRNLILPPLLADDYITIRVGSSQANDITIATKPRLSMIKLTGVKGDTGPAGTNGADGDITWEGAWVSQNYVTNQAVEYNGSSYVCKLNTVSSELPTNSTYWDLLASKGDTGSGGGNRFITIMKDTGGDLSTSSNTYSKLARMVYDGANETLQGAKVNFYVDDGATSVECRIYDVTNAQEIASVTTTSTSETNIVTFGSLSNLPTSLALLNIEFKVTGAGSVKTSGILMEF